MRLSELFNYVEVDLWSETYICLLCEEKLYSLEDVVHHLANSHTPELESERL